jgi:hypothetical protein
MKIHSRLFSSALWPLCVLVAVLAFIALACSNSKPESTQTTKTFADQPQKPADSPQIPLATHVVFSPLVGSGGTPAVPDAFPKVEIFVSPEALKVGEKVTVTILPGDLESPICYLFVRDRGAADVASTVGVSAGNEIFPGTNTSQVLELVSASGRNGQVVFILQGLGEGTTEVWASVIPRGSATGGVASDGVSESKLITVQK